MTVDNLRSDAVSQRLRGPSCARIARMKTVVLLLCSNLFMTAAWYGHLRHKDKSIWLVILASWLIALPEYMLQVPANRWGHGVFSAPQLKVMQEAISLVVFAGFSALYLKEPLRWNHGASFALVLLAVALALYRR
jgi:uncharacterized protein